ncbi:type VI secretion system-associated FHA domain protein [Niveispirillum fermenti]|uniref:type VI secretion system-associated FHA domain protein n=1 Tax=Niveispirillum fermenti TaxID=1233113 RepID=UPI004043355A
MPLTVGRDEGYDWKLLDIRRNPVISRQHFRIDMRDGLYLITDLSLNGVFIDGRPEPLPKGRPQPLVDGQQLLIADYVLEFRVRAPVVPASPVRPPAVAAPVPAPAPVPDPGIDDLGDWDDLPADDAPRGHMPAPSVAAPDSLLARFLEGADLPAARLRPDVMPGDILFMAGRLCRENLEGLHSLLEGAEAAQRGFPAAGMSFGPGARHPLLKTTDMSRLLADLLAPPRHAGQPADQVTRLAYHDLVRWQSALSRLCERALDTVIDSLNPESIRREYMYQRSGIRKIIDKVMVILSVNGKFHFFWNRYNAKWNRLNYDKLEEYDEIMRRVFDDIFAEMDNIDEAISKNDVRNGVRSK